MLLMLLILLLILLLVLLSIPLVNVLAVTTAVDTALCTPFLPTLRLQTHEWRIINLSERVAHKRRTSRGSTILMHKS